MGIAERNDIVPCWREYPTERENIETQEDMDYKKDITSFYIKCSLHLKVKGCGVSLEMHRL